MSSRRKARILAFQALYAWDASGAGVDSLLGFEWVEDARREKMDDELAAFTRLLVAGAVERMPEVDAAIKAHLDNWTFERLKKVDLAILRLGAYSLMFQRDIPAGITIDEAIEIAKEYGAEESFRFVNGVLDGIRKSLAPEGQTASPDPVPGAASATTAPGSGRSS